MTKVLTRDRIIDSLKLFNKKAERLQTCKFVEEFKRDSCYSIVSMAGQPVEVTRFGPDQDAIDAFVLTIRFFIQDNEKSSFRNLAGIYKLAVIPKKEKNSFVFARDTLNAYLDSPTSFQFNTIHLNHRDILNTFIYGGLAHSNKIKKDRYDKWMDHPILAPMLTNEFVVIMYQVMLIILEVKRINEKLLNIFEV